MKTRKCGQTRCGYNQMGGCQACDVCGVAPNEVNDNCDRCYNCEFDEGLLRWDAENQEKIEDALKKAIKDVMNVKGKVDEADAKAEAQETKQEAVASYVS